MPQVAVVTDTTHCLPRRPGRAGRTCTRSSLYVNWQGRQDREADLPDFDEYYEHLRTPTELPTTSQPSLGDFLAVYEPLLAAGRDIVSIHISAGLSGTHATAPGRRAVRASSGERRIEVVDSATGCGGLGLVVLAAAAAARAAQSVERGRARAPDGARGTKIWFCVDTMEYLRRGGRIGAARAWLGTTLKIKPILTFEDERHAGRAGAHRRAGVRADGRLPARPPRRRRRRLGRPARPGARAGERLVERGRELFGTRAGVRLGDRAGDRHARRARACSASAGVPARLLR